MANAIFRTEGALAHKVLRELHATYTVVVEIVAAEGGDICVNDSTDGNYF
tara:strand:- start:333 stop:482 length:150 start_codon:yes stop_codon:yes gene_type:complete